MPLDNLAKFIIIIIRAYKNVNVYFYELIIKLNKNIIYENKTE